METNNNMTAERSLEIITEQIAKSRQAASKDVGTSLYISGLCTAGMAVIIAVVNAVVGNGLGHFLWFLLPLIIWLAEKKHNSGRAATPQNLIRSLVGKTWWTFAVFTLVYFVFTILFNILMSHEEPDVYLRMHINPLRVILLLMGMAVTITGHILKQRWLVWCGIIGGLGGFVWESFRASSTLFGWLGMPTDLYCSAVTIAPCILVFLFSCVGLILPGYKIKK